MDIAARIQQVPFWRHRIPLPDGSVTPGSQNNLEQLAALRLPATLAGKSVLDIGCSDGFFSFECEKRGASRVVAIDNYSSVYIDSPHGFRVAHEILQSKVEFVRADFMAIDLHSLGTFDLVLFLGVMYHLRHPLYAIDKLAAVCRDQIVVETEILPRRTGWKWQLLGPALSVVLPESRMAFLEGDEVNRDPTNWWVPSIACVEGMLRSAGFCHVQTVQDTWTRGIFHGFSPKHGADVARFRQKYPAAVVEEACRIVSGDQRLELSDLTVAQFGRLKQAAAELTAKQWHRHDRWTAPR